MTARRLWAAREGAAAIEFAIIAPVFCLLLVGAFDMAHTLYMRTTIQGAVQKAARDASLEAGTDAARQAELDQRVTEDARRLANDADVAITRRTYRTFSAAADARPEDFTDTNRNGTCDPPRGLTPGEPYVDANNNGRWDADGGDAGQGGARDKTVYTVTVDYKRLLPLANFIPVSDRVSVVASTVLANQPYEEQRVAATPVNRNCP